ncbi:MAG: amidohydrolase family protein [Acidobacteria bacterium]|nr:amidohydrolase family protein [Acidobacteriota bacterium]
MMIRFANLLVLFYLLTCTINAQTNADPALLTEISSIKAIDNHAHPMGIAGAGGKEDEEYDAIACGKLEFVSPPPIRLRPDNPIYTGAWREFYGYSHDESMNEVHVRELLEAKRRVMRQQGDNYPAWVLDKLNIETMLTNRVAKGRGLVAPRFRWVAYGDPLMLPLSTKTLREQNPDRRFFYSQEEMLLRRDFAALKLSSLPPTLDLYLSKVVTPTLERQKREGAIALKFVAAYMRPLDFSDVPRAEAARIYARYSRSDEPPWNEYKKLQDFLFRYISREAGRIGLVVHLHTGGGCGHYFNLSGSNPLLLESVLNDPTFRQTKFVLVHGGYPFVKETEFLLEKPNVFADFSAQTFLLTPQALARVLRGMLEYEPEKVLFGTDASPATPEVSWEESAWLTNKTAREALALALTGMLAGGDITRARAMELARMVLRENAMKLYGFDH